MICLARVLQLCINALLYMPHQKRSQRANAAQVKEMLSLTEKIVWQPEMDDSPSFIGSPASDECMEKLVKNRGITQLLFYLSDAAIAQVS